MRNLLSVYENFELEKIHNTCNFVDVSGSQEVCPYHFFARLRFVFDWISQTIVAHVELLVSAFSVLGAFVTVGLVRSGLYTFSRNDSIDQ